MNISRISNLNRTFTDKPCLGFINQTSSTVQTYNIGTLTTIGRQQVVASAKEEVPAEALLTQPGTPIPPYTVCVVGATGTLGRQVVKIALDQGYDVRCIVRPRYSSAEFLRDWGATTVQADLLDTTSLPAALVGVNTIIDCSTARPEENTWAVDWEGKKALIQCAQAMRIPRYIFCSIYNCDQHQEVPLMKIKHCTEEFLKSTDLDYTIVRFCGFMQAIIGNYAVPILEERKVWGTTDETRTAYLDTEDASRMIMACVRHDATIGQTMTLAGPEAFTTQEIIEMCEKYAECKADVTNVPVWLLKRTRGLLRSFQWARDAADRLAFAEVLNKEETWTSEMEQTYRILELDPEETITVDTYLREYFTRVIKKLKEVGAESKQTNIYL